MFDGLISVRRRDRTPEVGLAANRRPSQRPEAMGVARPAAGLAAANGSEAAATGLLITMARGEQIGPASLDAVLSTCAPRAPRAPHGS
jgi:hypothetical protein